LTVVVLPGYHLLFYSFSCSVRLGIGENSLSEKFSHWTNPSLLTGTSFIDGPLVMTSYLQ